MTKIDENNILQLRLDVCYQNKMIVFVRFANIQIGLETIYFYSTRPCANVNEIILFATNLYYREPFLSRINVHRLALIFFLHANRITVANEEL